MQDSQGFDHNRDRLPKSTPVPAPLILASGSPRRHALLATLGVPFRVIVSETPESIDSMLAPEDQAALLAMRKARAVASGLDAGRVIGADTMVVLDGEILGKPADDEHAKAMLRRLSGREHQVVTGVALVDAANGSGLHRTVISRVRLKPLRDDEIAAYVATGEPRDKAGAHAIQGIGAGLIAGIDVPPPGGFCRLPDGTLCTGSV